MKSQKLGFLRSLLWKWQSQATLIGKVLLPVFLIIRRLTLGAAVQAAWQNDESDFICNTQWPGCEPACFTEAQPLSPARLWTLQLALVLAPGLVFLCYLIHLTNQEDQARTGDGEVKGHTLWAYLACMASVILVEAGFVVAQSSLYGFWVDPLYICGVHPCPHSLDCIIPRAWEKTVCLAIMFTASCVSLLLSVAEVVCVLLRAKPWSGQPDGADAVRSGSEVRESWCFLRQMLALWHSHAGLVGKTVLPVLQYTRLVIVDAVVEPVWYDDFGGLVCNTQQPGCAQAVFNKLFPFSLYQYWTLQVVLVLAPGLIFFCYLAHVIVMEKKDDPGPWVKGRVLRAYLGHLSAVILLEVGFAVGQALMFGFSLSTYANTGTWPCPHTVDCFVSRAREKTLLMVIMFSVACLSGLLTLVEMVIVCVSERPWEKRQKSSISETSGIPVRYVVEKEADPEYDNGGCTKLPLSI